MPEFKLYGSVLEAAKSEYESTQQRIDRMLARQQWLESYGPLLPDSAKARCYYASDLMYGLTIKFHRDDLPLMRKVLGRLHVDGKEVCNSPCDEHPYGTVNVSLHSDDHPLVSFTYERELGPESKCKIITETYMREPRTDHNLVCSVQ